MSSHAPANASDTLTQAIDERANWCFGCGPANPQSLHLTFQVSDDPITATAQVTLTRFHEGPPGYIHGGIVATLLDEAMAKLNRPLNLLAMTRNLSVDYLRPSPLLLPLTLTATHSHREGRKVFHAATLTHPNGTLLARAQGLFIVIDPAHLPAS